MSLITTTGKESLFLIMDYIGPDNHLPVANRSLHEAGLDYIWRENYLTNPFLHHLFSRSIPLNRRRSMPLVYRHIRAYMERNGLRPPVPLLIGTAEAFGAAEIRDPINRRTVLLFARLTPLFLQLPQNQSFHRLRAELKAMGQEESFSMDDLAAPITRWLRSPENRPLTSRIIRLDISRMGLDQVPVLVSALPNLRTLDMRDNRLIRPPHFGVLHHDCPRLGWIQLNGNPFRNSSEPSAILFPDRGRIKLNGARQDSLD